MKTLELQSNVTPVELEKYKLLVNESDVINNLILKLCNKLANAENSINWINLNQGHKMSKAKGSGSSSLEVTQTTVSEEIVSCSVLLRGSSQF